MTYGMDFRSGSKCLPRHDNVPIPPVQIYVDWFATLEHKRGLKRGAVWNPPKIRRIVYMCNQGESLHRACGLLGINAGGARYYLERMPLELLGPSLAYLSRSAKP